MRVADGPVIYFRAGRVGLVPRNGRGRVHLAGEDDGLVSVRPVVDRRAIFPDLLLEDGEEKFISLREVEGIGRQAVAIPVGEQLNLLQ